MLEYKLEAKGGMLLKADRYFASSQICSNCGYRNTEVKDLGIREWSCPKCGMHHDRDINAAENMKAEGIKLLNAAGIIVTWQQSPRAGTARIYA